MMLFLVTPGNIVPPKAGVEIVLPCQKPRNPDLRRYPIAKKQKHSNYSSGKSQLAEYYKLVSQ
jgi:hypothetical protein